MLETAPLITNAFLNAAGTRWQLRAAGSIVTIGSSSKHQKILRYFKSFRLLFCFAAFTTLKASAWPTSKISSKLVLPKFFVNSELIERGSSLTFKPFVVSKITSVSLI